MRRLLLFACALAAGALSAADEFDTSVDRSDPNFVKASLLVIGPGNQFFGCAGHSSLRLECPQFNLDNCFSIEHESIADNLGRFVRGKLKSGMFAVPTKEFLKSYESEGRRAVQYPLTLPADAKQRLWKIMDEQVARGTDLPYDYIRYCCVQSILQPILEAIKPYPIEFPKWSERYQMSRREILAENLSWCPWTRLFLHLIAGTEVDRIVSPTKTVILSPDFVELFRQAKVMGRPLIEGEGEVLLPFEAPRESLPVRPMHVAVLLLALAVANCFLRWRWIDWAFLGLQFVLGLLLVHLLCFSDLPASDWNWLIVPFNPLPLVFWRWRRWWGRWAAAGLAVWALVMALAPHQLTDPAFVVLALALAVGSVRVYRVS